MPLLSFDLASAEWHVTAHLSRDPNMIAVSKSGKSPYPATGRSMCGVSEELIEKESALVKLIRDPERIVELRKQLPELATAFYLPRTMSIRQAAKKAALGCNYREGYRTFALKNEMDEPEAKRIVDLYRNKAYPGLNDWYKRTDAQVRETRTLTNCLGRVVYFGGAMNDELFRAATAFVPQSTVVDVTDQAMTKMLDDDSADFAPACLLAQVHDSLMTEYLSRDYAAMARYAMKLGLDYMSPTLDYGEPFKLGVQLKVGFDWKNMTEIALTPDPIALAASLAAAAKEKAAPLMVSAA